MVKVLTTLILAVAVSYSACAQEYDDEPVNISKEKVRIDGQVCYSHIVLEKQTLYSICKAYDVSIEDIYRFNPSVKLDGLKKNSILIIPVSSNNDKKEEEQPEAKKAAEKKAVATTGQPRRKIHTVKWYEEIEGIEEKYGVSVGAIMQANNLKSRKLSKRQRLQIPLPGEYPDESVPESEEIVTAADTVAVSDSLQEDERKSLFPNIFFPKKNISVSLLMPLKATGSTGSRQNMDFYSGVLLAVYDMQKEGISTELNVYDVADGNLPTDASAIRNSDLVIGPVASGDITRMLETESDIKALISPLDPRAEDIAYANKAMIQAPTPHSVQYNDLVSWIKEDMKPEDRVLFITEKGARQTDATLGMTAAIDSLGIEYKSLAYSILEGRNVTETLAYLMSETSTNRVYIASESEAFVNDVVRNLNVMIHQKYDVVLYAPSKIRSFETIEVENFHNTNMHVSTGYYIDYDNPEVMEFLLSYRALYNTEPTQFAYQGYDIAKYFIGLCSKYGNRWMEKLDEGEESSMLQSTFRFTGTPDGGYLNNGVRRIIYGENWSVEKIR